MYAHLRSCIILYIYMHPYVHTCAYMHSHTYIMHIHAYGDSPNGISDSEMYAIVDIYKHHFMAFNDGHQFNAFTCVYAETSLI